MSKKSEMSEQQEDKLNHFIYLVKNIKSILGKQLGALLYNKHQLALLEQGRMDNWIIYNNLNEQEKEKWELMADSLRKSLLNTDTIDTMVKMSRVKTDKEKLKVLQKEISKDELKGIINLQKKLEEM